MQKPIARATLSQLSGLTAESQRNYERQLGIQVQFNYAIGEQLITEGFQEQAWQRGRGVFELVDHQGQQGKKGRTYLAWQLPNNYICDYPHRPKGQQKRINRLLNGLVLQGMPGNKEQKIEKLYYCQGADERA